MPVYASVDSELIRSHEQELLRLWLENLKSSGRSGDQRTKAAEVEQQAKEFLNLVIKGIQGGNLQDLQADNWAQLRAFLENFSRDRAQKGFTSDQTATFIFSFKKGLFDLLKKTAKDADSLVAQLWTWTELIDSLGLHTFNAFQRTREEVIQRQHTDMLELSTPVIKLWDGVLALPMIGVLDSARTQVVMETLLQRIVETGSHIAILDITGVPTVDTLVAQHLMKTVTAIRLMGAECIVSGIRPQIAQTIVHLGVDLAGITTKANLADALALAMKRSADAMVTAN